MSERDASIGNAKIKVNGPDLARGYRDGFTHYQSDYPDSFPSDIAIHNFLLSRLSGNLRPRYAAGYVLGWCAALLARSMYVQLPTSRAEDYDK